MQKILIIDDDKTVRFALKDVLTEHEFQTIEASNGRQGIDIFKKEPPDVVLLDLKMPDMDGIETLQELKKIDGITPIIILSGFGDIPTAIETIKLGAYDFITKPPEFDKLIFTIKRAVEKASLEKEVTRLNKTVYSSLEGIFGKSEAMKNAVKQIYQVAFSDFSIILQGETGTGKTTIARTIHNMSRRTDKPFITVDIGAIPETLVESELFGHKRGAFTGAEKDKKGFFEIANGGTILIDEIQNMSFNIQAKLLRAVEEKRIYPVGSTKYADIDVRIIAASNTDIKQAVNEKRFREDLYFRLNEFMITVPPLRDRVEDIPFLAYRFLDEVSREINKHVREIEHETLNLFKRYPWSGNVRELRNVIRKAVLVCDDSVIKTSHIEFLIGNEGEGKKSFALLPLKETVKDVEKKTIKKVLELTNNNKSKAASALQIDYKTLLSKIKEYGF